MKYTIPDISGQWKISQFTFLTQATPETPVDIRNVESRPDAIVKITQNQTYVVVSTDDLDSDPIPGNFVPVFSPEGQVVNWQLVLSYVRTNLVVHYQVTRSDTCGRPVEFFGTGNASGFSADNPDQRPLVTQNLLTKLPVKCPFLPSGKA